MQILDGKRLSRQVLEHLKDKTGSPEIPPCLAVVLVGSHEASRIYVKSKEKAAATLGFVSRLIHLNQDCSSSQLSDVIARLNTDKEVHGILLQLPLPPHLDPHDYLCQIDPQKDVDGFHPRNVGALCLDLEGFVPCTPLGVMTLIDEYKIELSGANVVMIGKSNLVGKPLSQLLLKAKASVSILHKQSRDLKEFTKSADLIITACGAPNLIGPEHLGRPCYLIDVGITRLPEGGIVGDMDFAALSQSPLVKGITPVPGGVGPMTIAGLMVNLHRAWSLQNQSSSPLR